MFEGERLRLARLAIGLSLEELGGKVSATRQYLNQLELNTKSPSEEMLSALAAALDITADFLGRPIRDEVKPEQCHFRKQRTTPMSVVAQVLARGTLLDRFVSRLDSELELPPVSFPSIQVSSLLDIEVAAEGAREFWRLGTGPISNMVRVVENAGAIISFFSGVSERVDALSIDRPRPMIIRSEAKPTACRFRFDLAHECGHLIMHKGVETGDKLTEDQANRFANAFLLPRSAFIHEFPRGRKIDWAALYALKRRWKVSVAAMLRRAYDLRIIGADQYRTGYIHLSKTGQRRSEYLDDAIPMEEPELLRRAMDALEVSYPGSTERLAREAGLGPEIFLKVSGLTLPSIHAVEANVIPFVGR